MIDENYINSIYEKFSIEDDEVLINKFKEIIKCKDASDIIKSEAYCGIGDIINFLAPEISEDLGYKYVSVKDFTSTKNIILLVKLSKH